MSRVRVTATSRAATDADKQKRDAAWEVIQQSNEAVVGFAKLMVPTSLTAVGVIVSLSKDILHGPQGITRTLVIIACVLALISAVIFAHTIYARRVRVSPDDYDGVLDELLAVAALRQRETAIAFGFLTVAVLVGVLALMT